MTILAHKSQVISCAHGKVLEVKSLGGMLVAALIQNTNNTGNVLNLWYAEVQYPMARLIKTKFTVCLTSIIIEACWSTSFLGMYSASERVPSDHSDSPFNSVQKSHRVSFTASSTCHCLCHDVYDYWMFQQVLCDHIYYWSSFERYLKCWRSHGEITYRWRWAWAWCDSVDDRI